MSRIGLSERFALYRNLRDWHFDGYVLSYVSVPDEALTVFPKPVIKWHRMPRHRRDAAMSPVANVLFSCITMIGSLDRLWFAAHLGFTLWDIAAIG